MSVENNNYADYYDVSEEVLSLYNAKKSSVDSETLDYNGSAADTTDSTGYTGGFSFCGVDVLRLGLYYAPELSDTFVYKNAAQSQHEETFAAHTGGIYYGSNAQPKEFNLRCFFEDRHINRGIIDNILNFFYTGRTGRLIFNRRDWCWYNATVVSVDPDPTNLRNGFITIKMKSYYPFARTNIRCKAYVENYDGLYDLFQHNVIDGRIIIDEDIYEGDSFIEFWSDSGESDINTAQNSAVQNSDFEYLSWGNETVYTTDLHIEDKAFFVDEDQMPETFYSNISSNKNIILYNAGNEYAALGIKIKGNAGSNGITIKNNSTNQEMKVVAFNKSNTTNANKYVYVDGVNGKTTLTDGTNSQLALIYHDHGFLNLKPARPEFRDVIVVSTSGSNIVRCLTTLTESCVGKYMCLNTTWYKITRVYNDKRVQLDKVVSETADYYADIVDANEISIELSNGAAIDEIEFVYKHTFR